MATREAVSAGSEREDGEAELDVFQLSFYQALATLERKYPGKSRFGEGRRPSEEPPARIGQDLAMGFAPSAVSEFQHRGKNGRGVVTQSVFGLFGPNGPMPRHLTEFAYQRAHNLCDRTLIAFADIFHHRLASLFYRAWANTQPVIDLERTDSRRYEAFVGTFIGLMGDRFRGRDALPDYAKFFYAGWLSSRRRSAAGLAAMLSDLFGVEIGVQEFVGNWLSLPDADLSRVGSNRTGQLGHSAVLGKRVWNAQHKFRVQFTGIGFDEFLRLAEGGERRNALVSLVRNYVGDALIWDMEFILRRVEIRGVRVGGPARLGVSSWLDKRRAGSAEVVRHLVSVRPSAYVQAMKSGQVA
jgi:type VI secretion system protein ImpH